MSANEPEGDPTPAAEDLPDEATVIRGGVMAPRQMEINAYTHYDEKGEFALSVFSLPTGDFDHIARVANLPNGQLRVSSVGRIRQAGYEIVRSEPPLAHADLMLMGEPNDHDWETLRAIFEPPIPNPYQRR